MIDDKSRVQNVEKEWEYLKFILQHKHPDIFDNPLTVELHKVNKQLWDVEDDIRSCERAGVFEGQFISLARSVYKLNDHRANLKKQINIKYNSEFIEEKSYKEY